MHHTLSKPCPFSYLVYAGLLPFIILSVCLWHHITVIPYLGPTLKLFMLYALVIHSFMAGSHWTLGLRQPQSLKLLLLSNVLTLSGFFSLVALPPAHFLVLLSLCYGLTFLVDAHHYRKSWPFYYQLRLQATSVVVLSCLAVGVQNLPVSFW